MDCIMNIFTRPFFNVSVKFTMTYGDITFIFFLNDSVFKLTVVSKHLTFHAGFGRRGSRNEFQNVAKGERLTEKKSHRTSPIKDTEY